MLRVLTYHRVAPVNNGLMLNPRLISATPETFAQQLAYLAKNYQVVSIEEVLEAVEKGARLPGRAVLLTFDDAYVDFGEIAWPMLKRYRLPATLFVPTAYPDHPERSFWWDLLYRAVTYSSEVDLCDTALGSLPLGTPLQRQMTLRRMQSYLKTIPYEKAMELVDAFCARLGNARAAQRSVLSWKELRQLANDGVALGAHSRSHAILTQLPSEKVREEVVRSQEDLRREIGRVLPIFCYPNGSHDDRVTKILRKEGFRLAFTTLDGHNDLSSAEPLRLRRTNITRRTSLPIFRLRLLRVVSYVDMWRHRGNQ